MMRAFVLLLLLPCAFTQRINLILGVSSDQCAYLGSTANGNVCLSANRNVKSHTIVIPHDKSAADRRLTSAVMGTTSPKQPLGNQLIDVQGDRLTDLDNTADALNDKQGEMCIGTAVTPVAGGAATTPCTCDATYQNANLVKTSVTATRDTSQGLTIPIVDNAKRRWVDPLLESADNPRPLCWKRNPGSETITLSGAQNTDWVFSGLWITTAFNCVEGGTDADAKCTAFTAANLAADLGLSAAADTDRRTVFFAGRSSCCSTGSSLNNTYNVAQCVNNNLMGCCGGMPYDLTTEKCCDATNRMIANIEDPCVCNSDANCASDPLESSCCLQSKYAEFTGQNYLSGRAGQCYNPNTHRCCNTGERYDPGSQQCCSINGLQSLDVPCPCGADADCAGGQGNGALNQACCKQTLPSAGSATCDSYDNYPSGTGHYAAQRCLGVCYDTAYQTCCNGAVCRSNFEMCCNSTCCNKFTSTCAVGQREGSGLNRYNPLNYAYAGSNAEFRQCTEIENLNPIRAFWVFILPAALLTATLASLALVLVFANKASARSFSLLERFMVLLSLCVCLLSCALFFAPVYKYGAVIVLASLVTLTSAALRVKFLNVLCVAFLALTLLFVVDPFVGNALGTFSSLRVGKEDTLTHHASAGLFHSTGLLWHSLTGADQAGIFTTGAAGYSAKPLSALSAQAEGDCVRFYDYFRMDDQLVDIARRDNPMVSTFGFCARGWIFTLLLVEAFIVVDLLLLFVLALLALLIRFRKEYDNVELQAVIQ
eukprot:NODE_142_length_2518_cov_703.833542_g138_i0.p1 GENE.NODE_142_length_2518_cov_703.833542_g138_i0~~NODE_142_length_2518_cov_703.833542_g138_i0.p1  ORF type:complete len:767 (+),score=203.24 NODE_142_length_2518_cov_703.833542_g138_i0:54-2354(+)